MIRLIILNICSGTLADTHFKKLVCPKLVKKLGWLVGLLGKSNSGGRI